LNLFDERHVEMILRNLLILEQGWKLVTYSNYTDLPMRKRGGGWAGFEDPAGEAAVITKRLEQCGRDGVCVYLCYCFRRDREVVAKMMGMRLREMNRRMREVITYISGEEPKPYPYRHYIAMKGLSLHKQTIFDKAHA
jgi:hypothetical protein